MIPGISHRYRTVVLYYGKTVVFFGPVEKGKDMKIGKKELENLRNELEEMLEFIKGMEQGELHHIYRSFNMMKLDIEMYFRIG